MYFMVKNLISEEERENSKANNKNEKLNIFRVKKQIRWRSRFVIIQKFKGEKFVSNLFRISGKTNKS